MGIYNLINKLKETATDIPMVNQCTFGDINDYNEKASNEYPYVNIDIIKADVVNFAQTYTFRIYVCDINKPFTAYNKTENILNTFLKRNGIDTVNYDVNYFSIDFKDMINGVWADMLITVPLVTECDTFVDLGEGYITDETNDNYVLSEDGDLIKLDKIV